MIDHDALVMAITFTLEESRATAAIARKLEFQRNAKAIPVKWQLTTIPYS